MRDLPPRPSDPNLLVGTETSDDAGVYLVAEGLALVQTIDFFPPLVDDPTTFGKIAATNALSDVYAMNGRPITAMNLAGFPDDELPLSILSEILRGGGEVIAQAGAVLLGGHTVRDKEVKYGLSVTGLVDPAEIWRNSDARIGDLLVLTKPLGTGFVATAHKKDECPDHLLEAAVASMLQLNAVGRDALRAAGGAHAVTDVTGYGLAGHASELAAGAGVTVEIDLASLPIIEGAAALAIPRYHTRGSSSNRAFLEGRISMDDGVDRERLEFVFDPQTSGGLLVAIEPSRLSVFLDELTSRGAKASAVIGRIVARQGDLAVILR